MLAHGLVNKEHIPKATKEVISSDGILKKVLFLSFFSFTRMA